MGTSRDRGDIATIMRRMIADNKPSLIAFAIDGYLRGEMDRLGENLSPSMAQMCLTNLIVTALAYKDAIANNAD